MEGMVVFTSANDEAGKFAQALGDDWQHFIQKRRIFINSSPHKRHLEEAPDSFDLLLVWEPFPPNSGDYENVLLNIKTEITNQNMQFTHLAIVLHGNSDELHGVQKDFLHSTFEGSKVVERTYSHHLNDNLYNHFAGILNGEDNG